VWLTVAGNVLADGTMGRHEPITAADLNESVARLQASPDGPPDRGLSARIGLSVD
jgi:hypothetical protein